MTVSDQNLLGETVAILISVRTSLARRSAENRAEIANISSVIKRLQAALRTGRTEQRRMSENFYSRRIEQVHMKKAGLLGQIKDWRDEQKGSKRIRS
jgi:hypothetical protein